MCRFRQQSQDVSITVSATLFRFGTVVQLVCVPRASNPRATPATIGAGLKRSRTPFGRQDSRWRRATKRPQRRHSTFSTAPVGPKPMVTSTTRKSWKPRKQNRRWNGFIFRNLAWAGEPRPTRHHATRYSLENGLRSSNSCAPAAHVKRAGKIHGAYRRRGRLASSAFPCIIGATGSHPVRITTGR